ncbi:MAG: phosphate ABC transporter permease subunit PstC [Acidobacteria bacterium]|nr:phosphate ABC transporter permease subunit PstC [Acidobacteriota bacterium]
MANRNPIDYRDKIFKTMTFAAAMMVLVLIAGIFFSLVKQAVPAISKFGFFRFISTATWDPVHEVFGAAASLYGTIVTTVLAMSIAIPVSIGIAIFMTELCPNFLKSAMGTAIELLAAIPSIIYGMWGLFTLAPIMGDTVEPFLQQTIGRVPYLGSLFSGTPLGIDILTASTILSIMIIPFMASIARDTFNLTPQVLRESAYGIGATRWEVIRNVVIPYSRKGVLGGIVIAMGRALGETMAVAFVLGNKHEIAHSLLDASATITVTLANEFTEADSDIYMASLFYLAVILFVMSFLTLAAAKFLLKEKIES